MGRRIVYRASGAAALVLFGAHFVATAQGPSRAQDDAAPRAERQIIDQYCIACHNARTKSGELTLESADLARVGDDPQSWERVLRRLRARAMPPAGVRRPAEHQYEQLVSY